MTRKKVKLAFITNDTARKATFKKRKKGFLKKLTELTTLCGIQACAIIFSPFDPTNPHLWPSPNGVHRVLSHFKTLPEMDQHKKMVNQETFLRHRIAKAASQLKKLQRDNREKEIAHLMFRSLLAGRAPPTDLNVVDLNDLGWMVDQKVDDICKRMESLTAANQPLPEASVEPGWFADMVCQGGVDDQMGLNVGDDVIQFPSFGEDENLGGFSWSNNNAFFHDC